MGLGGGGGITLKYHQRSCKPYLTTARASRPLVHLEWSNVHGLAPALVSTPGVMM